jgi:hypothetical protein
MPVAFKVQQVHVIKQTASFFIDVPIYFCEHCALAGEPGWRHADLLTMGLFPSTPVNAVELWRNVSGEIPIVFDTAWFDYTLAVQMKGSAGVSDEALVTGTHDAAQRHGEPVNEDRLQRLFRQARLHYMVIYKLLLSITSLLSALKVETPVCYAADTGKPADACAACHEAGQPKEDGDGVRNIRELHGDGHTKAGKIEASRARVQTAVGAQILPADRRVPAEPALQPPAPCPPPLSPSCSRGCAQCAHA